MTEDLSSMPDGTFIVYLRCTSGKIMNTPFKPGAEVQLRLDQCQQLIGYQFNDLQLLYSALLHASGADRRRDSNERLEFLGDAILGCVVCEQLFHRFPEYLEGDLTRIKSVVVSRQTCAKISQRIGLEPLLIVGKGMSSGVTPPSLLSDVFESIVAAIYLDGGDAASRRFIIQHMDPEIDAVAAGRLGGNYKSQLQQLAQREHGSTPVYQLVDEKGPDHSKSFKITAQVAGTRFEPAWGKNKKEAEQKAACNALLQLRGETPIVAE